MLSLIQEVSIKRGTRAWRASDERRWHREGGRAFIPQSREIELRTGKSRGTSNTVVPAAGLLAGHGGRDQSGNAGQCGHAANKKADLHDTANDAQKTRALRELQGVAIGRGGVVCI